MIIEQLSQIIEQHDGDQTADRYFYLHDRLSSVRQIIDTSGSRRYRLGTLKAVSSKKL